jgi:signal transduction histidine kinase
MKAGFFLRITLITVLAILIVIVASFFTIKELLWSSVQEIAAVEKEQLQLHVGNVIATEMPNQLGIKSHYSLQIFSPTITMQREMTITVDGTNQRLDGTLHDWPLDIPKKVGKHPYNGVSAGLPQGDYLAQVFEVQLPVFDNKAFQKKVRENAIAEKTERYAQSATSMLMTIAKVIMWVIIGIVLMYFILGKSFKNRLSKIDETLSKFSGGELTSRLPTQDTAKGDELGILSQRVNETLDKTERLVSGLDRMTSQISHELKDELSSLEKNLVDLSTTLVSERVDGMRNLIDEILELVRLESDVDETSEVFYLSNPIIEAVEVYSDSFEDAEITLKLSAIDPDCGPRILGRQALISRLVANLLSNILRYAAESNQVSISIVAQANLATLIISDEGPGLPVDDVDQLAKDARRRQNASGYGAGLRFVRAVALRHGGNISLSTTEKGLTVFIRLPIQ